MHWPPTTWLAIYQKLRLGSMVVIVVVVDGDAVGWMEDLAIFHVKLRFHQR